MAEIKSKNKTLHSRSERRESSFRYGADSRDFCRCGVCSLRPPYRVDALKQKLICSPCCSAMAALMPGANGVDSLVEDRRELVPAIAGQVPPDSGAVHYGEAQGFQFSEFEGSR
jgi:hypothetical protein